MYPGDFNGYFGFSGFGLDPGAEGLTQAYNVGYTYYNTAAGPGGVLKREIERR